MMCRLSTGKSLALPTALAIALVAVLGTAAAWLPARPAAAKTAAKSSKRGHGIKCETVNSGCNIFSSGESTASTLPTFKDATTGDVNKLPTYQQVRQIPSLKQPQRKDITKIYDDAKLVIQPLEQQLRELRLKSQKKDAQETNRQAIEELRDSIYNKREETWKQVKALLNDKQLEQLEQMRRGQLFTEQAPMTPVGQDNNDAKKQ